MIFVTAFTPGTRYERQAQRLLASLNRFELRRWAEHMEDRGDWRETVVQKPMLILNRLLAVREPVCWVDSDCEVMRLPSLLLGTACDFACFNFKADPENTMTSNQPDTLHSTTGVVMFGYTAAAIDLLVHWIQQVRNYPDCTGDDPSLDAVFNNNRPPVRPMWLPRRYNNLPHFGNLPDVVIRHHYKEPDHGNHDVDQVQAGVAAVAPG